MKRFERRPTLLWPLLAAITLLTALSVTRLSAQYIIEDPSSLLPGEEWYRIYFDSSGHLTLGEGWGYGGGWYYYPLTGTYRMWFYRGPFDANTSGCMAMAAGIEPVIGNQPGSAIVNFLWATQQWSALGHDYPPLPNNIATLLDEAQYVRTDMCTTLPLSLFGSHEAQREFTFPGYSPEWVGIDVKGTNAKVLRWVAPTCLEETPVPTGACYNQTTGNCFQSTQGDCVSPWQWLGANSSCPTSTPSSAYDFGNAPNTYKTLLASDGARHLIVSGVCLGKLITSESDGQPNTTPADNDGVVFASSLSSGKSVTLQVTASVQGHLSAWVDFGRNGTFADANDQIFADKLLSAGTNTLVFTVPASASLGDTWARFRFSTRGLLTYYGLATDGEVEDYKVTITGSYSPQPYASKGPSKWEQPPQSSDATTPYVFKAWGQPSDEYLDSVLADDWQCTDSRPVTGFQWWGTFSGWQDSHTPSPLPSAFHIAIWTSGTTGSFSHPDTLIWETYSTNWTWSVAGQISDPRKTSSAETCFEFTSLLSQDRWFYQDSTGKAKTYWLSIAAVYDANTSVPHAWGWLTDPASSTNNAVSISAVVSAGGSALWPPSLGCLWSSGSQIKGPQAASENLAFVVLTNQGASVSSLAPVYRFWSPSYKTHFYTIKDAEREKVVTTESDVWTYEGIAFYAYPPTTQPADAKPVYQFHSAPEGHQFYTIDETEKNNLLNESPIVWVFDGISWYAYD